jgi:hypothetical protein
MTIQPGEGITFDIPDVLPADGKYHQLTVEESEIERDGRKCKRQITFSVDGQPVRRVELSWEGEDANLTVVPHKEDA